MNLETLFLNLVANSKKGSDLPVATNINPEDYVLIYVSGAGFKVAKKSDITFPGEVPTKLSDLDTPALLGQKGKILVVRETEDGYDHIPLADVDGVTQVELNAALEDYVKTINGVAPDENGNVVVEGGGTVTAQAITDALGHEVANDAEVVKQISLNGGTPQAPVNGLVDLTVSVESAEVHTEDVFTWNTGNSQIFTVADSAKTTDVYVQGSRLAKGIGQEWNVSGATGIEILIPLTDGDNIAIVSSATAAPGGSGYDDTAITAIAKTRDDGYALSSPTADLTAGDTDSFHATVDFTLNGYFVGVTEAPTGSSLVVGLKKNGVSVTSSNAIIDSGETTSLTGTAPVITTASFLKGDLITPTIVQVGSLTTGKSLKIYLEITKS